MPLNQILYIYSEGSISLTKKTDGSVRSVNNLLKELEENLLNSKFFRIDNQYLVN
ncbi:hypothetical protein EGI22_10400 [Lacihabitans sp. LS3-19]|uniref:LytTR family transcriptional regulator DNA-binding domain-containing protein n=1 Tax=Lacihabitans sp. LS3-19 TaxID=2487335 RepID=UPI00288775BF|nr:hypothetical protein [Lacihabitans sp. LS3-19]